MRVGFNRPQRDQAKDEQEGAGDRVDATGRKQKSEMQSSKEYARKALQLR